jgi:hypothetical protein
VMKAAVAVEKVPTTTASASIIEITLNNLIFVLMVR